MTIKNLTHLILYIINSILLLLCLADMPYGFYSLVRFVTAASFCFFAYVSYSDGEEGKTFVFIALAILFQPFFKIALGRIIWNIVDIVVAIYLTYLAVRQAKNKVK